MTPTVVGIICFLICVMMVAVLLPLASERGHRDEWFQMGWDACMEAHHRFEMSEEDKQVLKEEKKALWAYIKANKMQKPGDKKRLDKVNDFTEMCEYIWDVCIYRKECDGK